MDSFLHSLFPMAIHRLIFGKQIVSISMLVGCANAPKNHSSIIFGCIYNSSLACNTESIITAHSIECAWKGILDIIEDDMLGNW